jgi:hypothetical protein
MAAAVHRAIGDWQREGSALTNLGLAPWEARRLEDAITAYQNAAAVYRGAGDREREELALSKIEVIRAAEKVILCSNCVRTSTHLAISPIVVGLTMTRCRTRRRWDISVKPRSSC